MGREVKFGDRHKNQVWGKLVVMTEKLPFWPENKVEPQTYEDILKEYRAYIHDPKAELPAELVEELKKLGKI